MCGRYLIDDDVYSGIWLMLNMPDEVHDITGGEIFPTNTAPVISSSGAAVIKWGFPHWKGSGVIINARAETALEKDMFRKPLLERRCVVPSNGYYEWSRTSVRKKKDKYLLRPPCKGVVCMAGMMNVFRGAAGGEYGAFVILTTTASSTVSKLHDRMPVVLAPDEHDLWISDSGFMEYALHRPGPEMVAELVQA